MSHSTSGVVSAKPAVYRTTSAKKAFYRTGMDARIASTRSLSAIREKPSFHSVPDLLCFFFPGAETPTDPG
eukprot:CAMPEP_0180245204 /NCGR_PEP_ID=MMETSP0987-20121128/34863_1 /TAXON_ID=697907 /ORGANISM="non described non described, Strain CCMP2293" /LENGTH=70 /DNA_ID=CAMNT_0022212831 /DNA_START=32 /DNA_END=240 /DNA_ORIENTATION=-